MAKAIPLVVMEGEPPGTWIISVGRTQFRIDKNYDTKAKAVQDAEQMAVQDERPGVAIYTRRAHFDRFSINEQYFEQFMWEDL